MTASRIGVTGECCSARFWFSAVCAALMPTSIGYQDLAALIAHERTAVTRWHLIASPVQAATFSYTRPIGTAIPEPLGFQPVNLDPRSLDAFSWKIDEPLYARPARQIEYPTVERSHKTDRLPANVITRAPAGPLSPNMATPADADAQSKQVAPADADAAPAAPAPAASQMNAHQEEVAASAAGSAEPASPAP